VRDPGAAVKVEAGMWTKVAVGASERRVMEAIAGVGSESAACECR
jgi:hypothetical protein